MDPVLELARRHRLLVIEDAAEVHGAEYKGRRCGGIGDISTFSFYANKLVTTGEGGMVLVRTPRLAEQARALRNLCFQPARRFLHDELGYNFRLTNLQAALGVAQLERFGAIVARKRAIGARYLDGLKGVKGIALPVEEPWARHVYWMFGLVLDDALPMDAAGMAERLRKKGIETRPFFLGMHEQPAFHALGLFRNEHHPVAERLARRGLYLPSGLTLTDAQIDEVVEAVRDVLG